MKFAKELEADLVPEWRAKYLDYKSAKKRLKAVSRALRTVNRTPASNHAPFNHALQAENNPGYFSSVKSGDGQAKTGEEHNGYSTAPVRRPKPAGQNQPLLPKTNNPETESLPNLVRYGSILGSPPFGPTRSAEEPPPSFRLPGAALGSTESIAQTHTQTSRTFGRQDTRSTWNKPGGPRTPGDERSTFQFRNVNDLWTRRGTLTQGRELSKLRNLLGVATPSPAGNDYPLEAYRILEARQAEFFDFLDSEKHKIEEFYKQKEDEASERLHILRRQLHLLRDRRIDELMRVKARKSGRTVSTEIVQDADNVEDPSHSNWVVAEQALNKVRQGRVGKQSKRLEELGTPQALRGEGQMDYVRHAKSSVPYRTAKHKLKTAMQEYYRGLELLKAYTLLNRKAFRKITKKYDKTVNARPTGRYMSEKINNSYFVKSDVLDGHIQTIEDLYARYFENGNHKVAAGKLRAKTSRSEDFGGSMFRNGLCLGISALFSIQALVRAASLLFEDDVRIRTNTSFLLQIYGGYFLLLCLTLTFGLALRFWTRSKVNFMFVFEFEPRSHLSWKQYLELPSFCAALQGLFMWLNFSQFGFQSAIFLYFPVMLIAATLVLILFPFPTLYHRSRVWFLYSNWRLLASPVYPVEFRDFFMGDMFCSQAYAMGNIELFFCVYNRGWDSPDLCNSSHSRLMGFFTALPPIWRFLQCLRRFQSTRNVFPHVVNAGKYCFSILAAMSLSLYRINKTHELQSFFIFCATVNSVYCTMWDLVMDWSLLDPTSKHPFLRDTLAFKQIWLYYFAIVVDPLLRFNWIFYIIFSHATQHSALLSFIIALSEVGRRSLWMLFRVENEHCTNVGRFRASRDVPLPFDLPENSVPLQRERVIDDQGRPADGVVPPRTPHIPAEPQTPDGRVARPSLSTGRYSEDFGESGLRRRPRRDTSPLFRGLRRMGSILHTAHAQDFERRKRLDGEGGEAERGLEDEEDDEDGSEEEDRRIFNLREDSLRHGRSNASRDEVGNGKMRAE